MKKFLVALLLLVVAVAAYAQTRRRATVSPQTLRTEATFAGSVASFSAAPGTATPQLVLATDDGHTMTFGLGPYWFLVQQKFVASVGDRAQVVAFDCPECANSYAVIRVVNLTAAVTLELRSSDGLPLWMAPGAQGGSGSQQGGAPGASGPACPYGEGPQGPSGVTGGSGSTGPTGGRMGMHGNGYGMMGGGDCPRATGQAGCQGSGPDMTRVESFEATVVSFTGGPGVGRPTLVVSGLSGERTLLVSPFRPLASSGYSFTPGTKLSVAAAPVLNDGVEEWVVLTFTDLASGFTVTLRDATTGLPLFGRHR